MSCRKFTAEYVARHLQGLTVLASLPDATPSSSSSTAALVIATHNGSFHCDEAVACGLLRHTPMYSTAAILRTRDPAQIDRCAIVVDVGAVYDADKNRFDHHQSSFNGTMHTSVKTYATRLSSAGLVYQHFGRDIIKRFIEAALNSPQRADILAMTRWPEDRAGATESELDVLFNTVYKNFVEEVDGVDNGVEPFGLADPAVGSMEKHYTQSTSLSARVGKLHSWWNEPSSGDVAAENAAFAEAVDLVSGEFFHTVAYFAFSWLPARAIVEEAFAHASEVDPSGKIVVFSGAFCPWKDHLLEIEKEHDCAGRVLYVLFSDGKGWRVQAVPKESSGFENRKPLPYRGLRDEELSTASGIAGGVFVHVSGFIGGMKTYEGALALAKKALVTD